MWLIADQWARELRAAFAKRVSSPEARVAFDEARKSAREQVAARRGGRSGPESLTIAGDIAEIRVEGILTLEPSFWLWFFGYGNTSYRDMQDAIAEAEADERVTKVVFHVDSPGGEVRGLFDTLNAIDAMTKPREVVAAYACSAAYSVAAVAGKIEATSTAVEIGSVGVVASYWLDEDLVEITSTEAPDKRPDVSTEAGKAVVRKHLDEIHDLFAGAIAQGRGVAVEKVNADFGRGGVMLAGEAKRRGMIDSIARPVLRAVPSGNQTSAGTPAREKPMDLKTLKSSHPQLCEELIAEGVTQGVAQERKRVGAHIKMGEKFGAVEVAHKAILEGTSVLDDDVHADYMCAGQNRKDRQARQDDSDQAGGAVNGADPKTPTGDQGDAVVAELKKQGWGKK